MLPMTTSVLNQYYHITRSKANYIHDVGTMRLSMVCEL